ncbi:hypothetical protein COU37_03035 [Candidatus Micrarchaeota archaeon CG10_big_fil_rev_8_21_14_0_10_45_29]|nr:MAG: hypothetical protein COU37_03035 [Candidatus Micrarchaeota archaeon CG10_big_fil_rev_8_21_14_0_10_45_29]QBM01554.1 hypothetical protein [uncultured archaeon]
MPDNYIPIKEAIELIATFLQTAYSGVEKAMLNHTSRDWKNTKTFENCKQLRISYSSDEPEAIIIKIPKNPQLYSIQKSLLKIKTNGEYTEKYKIMISAAIPRESRAKARPDRICSIFH